MAIADLTLRLMGEQVDRLQTSGRLPDRAEYLFDELNLLNHPGGDSSGEPSGVAPFDELPPPPIRKTHRRKVVTLKYGLFYAREVVRQSKTGGSGRSIGSSQLARLVAPGCQYGYDLVAHVGLESFLHGRRLEEIQQNLQAGQPALSLATSSLDELRRRFLFCLGEVHRQAAPRLKESLHQLGGLTWLIDGTLEPETAVFLGIQHARSSILLSCSKIPTENADDIAPCLEKTACAYGRPKRILHDLNNAMSLACEMALGDVPHDVCHYHFARDVGEDLLAAPQRALSGRIRSLKLQMRMREQRKYQTEWLREHAGQAEGRRVLQRLFRGEPLTDAADRWSETLGREVLLALHFWMLDYAADGGRQGFPFDPHFLYFHRRLLRGHEALVQLLSVPGVSDQAPRTLFNLRDQLQRYRSDRQILAAAVHYELAFQEFDRLRTALRLASAGDNPMHHGYELDAQHWKQVQEALDSLREEYRQRVEGCSEVLERDVCQTILTHLEKYADHLAPADGSHDPVRTTNSLEGYWSASKRACRHTQGRRKLTRTFNALPAELMFIPNLRNEEYLTIVLDGRLEHLPEKFAEAQLNSHSYRAWRRRNTSLNIGRLPVRILRQADFVERVLGIYEDQCHEKSKST